MSRRSNLNVIAVAAVAVFTPAAFAQWPISFTNQTNSRMIINLPDVAGDAIQINNDAMEKDYAWGDVNHDGWIDLVCVRKQPLSFPGGKRNILFINENGVLVDRTTLYAVEATGVPVSEGVSQGFLDNTNDRQVVLCDVNNDGWLDIVTAGTIADGLPRYIGHPRVYINKGADGSGNWLGFRYEYARIPQLLSKSGVAANPRFCSVSAGDLNGDGYVDLYFVDYDTGEVGPSESGTNDLDNKLLMNAGAANPGFFADETNTRMGTLITYPNGGGSHNLAWSAFGAHGLIVDVSGDGNKDVVKITTLTSPWVHVAVMTNPPSGSGSFGSSYKSVAAAQPYSVASCDLNNDGRMDLVITDDGTDRYLLNIGNDGNGAANFTQFLVSSQFTNESDFGAQITVTDLDNDGWQDFIIVDEDLDTFFPSGQSSGNGSRRTRVYHNLGNSPNVTMRDDNPTIMPVANLVSVYRAAAFDIDRDGWVDLVLGRGNPSGGNNAGSTAVWMNSGRPSVAFGYPSGRPTALTPNVATTFNVQLTGTFGGVVREGSPKIFVSTNGGAFTASSLVSLGGDLYQATIPATACGSNVRYYLAAQVTVASAMMVDPPGAVYASATPLSYFSAAASAGTTSLVNENFEGAVSGWTVANDGGLTNGAWEVAAPNVTWNEGVQAAPGSQHTAGGSKCYVTGNGAPGGALNANNVDGGATHLISPAIDLANSNASISYAYWFYTNATFGLGDALTVSVSNDNGANWTTVATHKGPKLSYTDDPSEANSWKTASFVVGDFVAPTSQVRVRFSANDAAPASIVEAGLDDFAVTRLDCVQQPPPCAADITGDSVVNVSDLLAVINGWGSTGGPADVNHDNIVNVTDLLVVINGWGSCPSGLK